MSVLAFATSVADIVQKESVRTGSTTSEYIAPYVNEGFIINEDDAGASSRYLYFDEVTGSFWVSHTFYWSSGTFIAGQRLFSLDSSSDSLLWVQVNASSNSDLELYYNDNGTDVLCATATDGTDVDASYNRVRVDVEFNYGESGYLKLYIDRQEIGSYSTDTTTSGVSPDRCMFEGLATTGGNTVGSSFFISDEDSTLLTMVQFELNGNGSYTDFTNDYSYLQVIGETGDNYSVESSEAGDTSTYTVEDRSSDIDGGTVVAVGLSCRAKTQEAVAADQFRFLTYDGTDTEYSEYIEMDQYITPYQAIFDTAPDGSAWTLSSIAAHEFGFEVSENG